jgi:uncharacterized protein
MEVPNVAFWIALLAMLVGLAGTILPALPGVGLIWLAALVYAIADGFTTLTPPAFAVLTILALLGIAADFVLSQAGSRFAGASWQALIVGAILGVVGFLFGLFIGGIGAVPGGIIGTLAGILLVEYRRRNDVKGALKAGGGWLAGCLVSRGVEFVLALVMIALFVWQAGVRGGAL